MTPKSGTASSDDASSCEEITLMPVQPGTRQCAAKFRFQHQQLRRITACRAQNCHAATLSGDMRQWSECWSYW
jgi:hypothetical protein